MDQVQGSLDKWPAPAKASVEETRLITRRAHLRAALLSVPVVFTLTSNASAQAGSDNVYLSGNDGFGGGPRGKGRGKGRRRPK